MIKCRKCGKGPNEITGYLARVNPKDEAGIWECAPSCHAKMTQEEAVLAAIEGKQPAAQSEREALEFERLLNRAIALSRDSRCEEARIAVLAAYHAKGTENTMTKQELENALCLICRRIEACGASPELTGAVMLASDTLQAVRGDHHAADRVRKALAEGKG